VKRYSGTGSYTLNVTFPGGSSGGGGSTPPPPSNTRPSKPSDLTVYITGNSADSSRQPVNGPAIVLMGGNFDIDETFVNRVYPIVNGGDVVVLRTSGTNGYNDYLYNLRTDSLRPDSVETMIVNTRTKANSAYVKWVLDTAEFIYIAGGNQSEYLNVWAGTEVENSLRAAYARGAVIGGISAGCAIMGQFIYDPDGVTAATSAEAIANPYRASMIISDTFLNAPLMANVITDTHFAQRDRMGRLMALMARLRQDGRASTIVGVGVDEDTALFIDRNRQAVVDGDFAVYILREDTQTARTRVTSGQSLIYTNVLRTKLTAGDTYNFSTNASNRAPIRLSVDGRNSQPYNPTNPY
jgi:cyanophycinase